MLCVLHTMLIINHILLLELYLILGHIGRKASLGVMNQPQTNDEDSCGLWNMLEAVNYDLRF